MSNVTFDVVLADAPLPPGVRSGDLQYVLTTRPGGEVINRFVTPDVEVEFPGIAVGLYTMTVQRLDSNGGDLGTSAAVDFEVAASTFGQPVSITVVSIV